MSLKKILAYFFITAITLSNNITHIWANINLTVSPIKYDFNATAWQSITKTAKLINLSNNTYTITTDTSDFIAKNLTWTPQFIRKDLGDPQQLSTWITINEASFSIGPKEEKDVEFTINIPLDATPGWHYGAIFFQNKNNGIHSGQIWVHADYWVLLLVNVDGDIIVDGYIEDPTIHTGSGGTNGGSWNTSSGSTNIYHWWSSHQNILDIKDNCIIDLTKSNYDGKCVDNPFTKDNIQNIDNSNNNEENAFSEILDTNDTNNNQTELVQQIDNFLNQDFKIKFTLPFENKWNTHLKPVWEITLTDENGNVLKAIWKKIVQNENGVVIGEEIVNYIPINDVEWSVLPSTKREFESQWLWFPYEKYDLEWKKVIDYWSPNEYYSNQNISKNKVIMPWQRINERITNKKITANFRVTYWKEQWKPVEFNSAKDFDIIYKEEYIWINPYFVIWAIFFGFMFLFFWIIGILKKKRCINKKCRKRLKKDMKICPYCWTDQEKKKKENKKKKK